LSAVSHRIVRWRGLVALVVVVMLAAGIGQTNFGHAILRKAGLFEEPTSYTSLAFVHPQSLREQLSTKRANINVSFVIYNSGGAARDYQWSVLMVQGGHTSPVAAGSARVASERGTALTRSAKIFCTRGRVQIVVRLARPAEYIDTWTACPSHRS
jgi:hypothetical protein